MNKSQFLNQVEEQLRSVFKDARVGIKNIKAKHRAEGFIHCGCMAGMSTETEVKELMERVHLEVFNQTIEQRQAEKNEINQLNEANDFQRLHIPAFLRLYQQQNSSN